MASVSRSGADYYDVHVGLWTNWSLGRIQGSTLTITRDNANIVVAVIALFVAASGQSLWRICCFILHRHLSKPTPRDGLYHQRQAILRNSGTPDEGAWRLMQILWTWRGKARQSVMRLLPSIILALVSGAAVLIGGIFSSKITSDTSSEVLIKGKNCAALVPMIGDFENAIRYLQPYQAQRATAFSNYALQCYTNSSNSEDCDLYLKPSISMKVDRNASCPFSNEMCKLQSENIRIDTGYINSHHDLGINAPPDERFEMRYVYQCAPIVSEGFREDFRPEDDYVPDMVRYFYGNLTYPGLGYTGFTYESFKNFSNMDMPGYTSASGSRPEFRVGTVVYYGGNNSAGRGSDTMEFTPIPALTRSDADTILLFLTTQGFGFQEPVDDPWYSAHDPWTIPLSSIGKAEKPLYLGDEPVSTVGCTQQVEFCNPNRKQNGKKVCELLGGAMGILQQNKGLWNEKQLAALNWTRAVMTSTFFTPSGLVGFIGTSVLVGRHNALNGIVGPLPRNQWQLEIEHIVGTTLTSLQGTFVSTAKGPPTKDLERFRYFPPSDIARKMCANQKILSTRFSSFSFFLLMLIILLGLLIITVDLTLEPLLNAYHIRQARLGRRSHRSILGSTHSRLEWRATSVLQLQRLAHAAVGSGTWFRTADETPVTLPFEKLGVLNVEDEGCPVYEAPGKVDLSAMGGGRSDVEREKQTADVDVADVKMGRPWMWKSRTETGMSNGTLVDGREGA